MNTFDYAALLSLDGLRDNSVGRGTSLAFYPDETFEIRYEGLPYGAMNGAIAWLYDHRTIITDPTFANIVKAGVWRTTQILEQPIKGRGGEEGMVLVQRFAKGYYKALDFDACRVEGGSILHGNETQPDGVAEAKSDLYGRTIILRMPFVDPTQAERITGSLSTVSFEDLVVAKNTKLVGLWFNMGANHKLEEDNTTSIIIQLGQPKYTVKQYSGEGAFYESDESFVCTGVPLEAAQRVIDAWKTLDGTPTGTPRRGATASFQGKSADTNTCTIILSTPIPKNLEERSVTDSEDCFSTTSSVLDINQDTPGTQPAFVQGKIVTTTNEITNLGKYNVTTQEKVAKPDKEGAFGHTESKFQSDESATVLNQTAPIVDPDASDYPPAPIKGEITQRRARRNEYCLWDNTEDTRKAKPVTDAQTTKQITAYETAVSDVDRNQDDPIVEETVQTAGKVVQTRNTVNEFDLNDHETTERTAREVEDASETAEFQAFESVAVVEDRNVETEPTLPIAQTAGIIQSLRKTLNDFLRWDVQTQTRTAVEKAAAGGSKTITQFETSEEVEGRNLVAEPTLPATPTPGIIKSISKKLNAFLRWDKQEQTRTATPVTDASVTETETAYETETRTTDRNVEVASTVTPVVGKIFSQTVEKSEFPERVHDTVTERAAVAVEDATTTKQITAYETAVGVVDRNQPAPIVEETVQTPGKIARTENTVNDFGLNDHQSTERTATAVTDARVSTTADAFSAVESVLDRNQATAVAEETSGDTVPGEIESKTSTLNDFQRYDNETTRRVAIPQRGTIIIPLGTGNGKVYWGANQPLAQLTADLEEAALVGNVQPTFQFNEFHLYDYRITAIPQGGKPGPWMPVESTWTGKKYHMVGETMYYTNWTFGHKADAGEDDVLDFINGQGYPKIQALPGGWYGTYETQTGGPYAVS